MMSISPPAAHVPYSESVGSIQKADHRPWPAGAWMLASTRPWVMSSLPSVVIRADVYSRPSGEASRRAVMTRWPPATAMLSAW